MIARGGSIGEWIWKGRPNEPASVEAVVARPDGRPLRHGIALRKDQQSFRLEDERIENDLPAKGQTKPYLFYHDGRGRPVINTVNGKRRHLNKDHVVLDASILEQRQSPNKATRKSPTWRAYMTAFGCIGSGRLAGTRYFVIRRKLTCEIYRLEEDFSNLGMSRNRLRRQPKTKAALLAGLANLYEGF